MSGLKESVDLMAFQAMHKSAAQNNKTIDSAKRRRDVRYRLKPTILNPEKKRNS
jgi:hypothetical protein